MSSPAETREALHRIEDLHAIVRREVAYVFEHVPLSFYVKDKIRYEMEEVVGKWFERLEQQVLFTAHEYDQLKWIDIAREEALSDLIER